MLSHLEDDLSLFNASFPKTYKLPGSPGEQGSSRSWTMVLGSLLLGPDTRLKWVAV